jgi:hypothetical protein
MDGTQPVLIDFQSDSDECWFNFRDNDKGTMGENSAVFSLRSQPRDKQTEWGLSEPDESEEEPEPTPTPTASSSQTSSSATAGPSTDPDRQNEANEQNDADGKDKGLGNGAKIGIGVGVGLGVFGLAAGIIGCWLMRQHRRASVQMAPVAKQDPNQYGSGDPTKSNSYVYGRHQQTTELYGSARSPVYEPAEMETTVPAELPAART